MSEETTPGASMAPERLAELLEGAELQLIDLRRDYEWDAGHIPGARHIEINELTAAGEQIDRERPVVFYCRGGNRSSMAAEAFRQAGFDAHNLAGGLLAWAERDLPLDPEGGRVADVLPPS